MLTKILTWKELIIDILYQYNRMSLIGLYIHRILQDTGYYTSTCMHVIHWSSWALDLFRAVERSRKLETAPVTQIVKEKFPEKKRWHLYKPFKEEGWKQTKIALGALFDLILALKTYLSLKVQKIFNVHEHHILFLYINLRHKFQG